MEADSGALSDRLSSGGDCDDWGAGDEEEGGALDADGQGVADGSAVSVAAGDAGDAVGEDTHGTGDRCGSRPGAADVGSEDFEDSGDEESGDEGSEDPCDGVDELSDELTDGVGSLTGGSVFLSLPPVSPGRRWNQSRRSGSYTTKMFTTVTAGAT